LTGPEEPLEAASEAQVEQWIDESGATVVRLGGEVDLSNVAEVRGLLEPVRQARPDRLVLDLADLRFMDSSGLALLIAVAEPAGSVALRNPPMLIRRIVEGAGLAEVLRFESP
jgi:anti-sigma B factor antagonist